VLCSLSIVSFVSELWHFMAVTSELLNSKTVSIVKLYAIFLTFCVCLVSTYTSPNDRQFNI